MNAFDDICHGQFEEDQEVPEKNIDADSIAEDEIGRLGQTRPIKPADLFPGSFFLFVLQRHPGHEIDGCHDQRYLRV